MRKQSPPPRRSRHPRSTGTPHDRPEEPAAEADAPATDAEPSTSPALVVDASTPEPTAPEAQPEPSTPASDNTEAPAAEAEPEAPPTEATAETSEAEDQATPAEEPSAAPGAETPATSEVDPAEAQAPETSEEAATEAEAPEAAPTETVAETPAPEATPEPTDGVTPETKPLTPEPAAEAPEAEAPASAEVAPEPTEEPAAETEAASPALAEAAPEEPTTEADAPAEPAAEAEPTLTPAADLEADAPTASPTIPPHLTTAHTSAALTLAHLGLTTARATTYLVLDRSASMRPFYKDGSAQALADQTLALAAHLSPADPTVHVVFFSTEVDGTTDLALADKDANTRVDDVHAGLGRMGRTTYHAAVEAITKHLDASADPDAPALVVFQTDGAPDAKTPATQSLTEAAKTHPRLFFSFVAFGEHENKAFDYLRKLKTDNTSFFHAGPTPKGLTDDELYEGVLKNWRP
ncbi:VWA domain-containing protein [Streptomyces sp. LBUM 1476]|nr:VWA domain-containing protein [Streptomyces sp. LBUM 1476]